MKVSNSISTVIYFSFIILRFTSFRSLLHSCSFPKIENLLSLYQVLDVENYPALIISVNPFFFCFCPVKPVLMPRS